MPAGRVAVAASTPDPRYIASQYCNAIAYHLARVRITTDKHAGVVLCATRPVNSAGPTGGARVRTLWSEICCRAGCHGRRACRRHVWKRVPSLDDHAVQWDRDQLRRTGVDKRLVIRDIFWRTFGRPRGGRVQMLLSLRRGRTTLAVARSDEARVLPIDQVERSMSRMSVLVLGTPRGGMAA